MKIYSEEEINEKVSYYKLELEGISDRKERQKIFSRIYYWKNRNKGFYSLQRKDYYQENKDKYKESMKKYHDKNHEKIKNDQKLRMRERRKNEKLSK